MKLPGEHVQVRRKPKTKAHRTLALSEGKQGVGVQTEKE